jgi:hypothetical protein
MLRGLLGVTLVTIGCSSGNWVDAPILTSHICTPDKEWASAVAMNKPVSQFIAVPTESELKKNMELTAKNFAQQTCSKAGGNFTGDTRCENGAGQVKCKTN